MSEVKHTQGKWLVIKNAISVLIESNGQDDGIPLDIAHMIIGCFFIGVFFGINSIWDCAAFTFKKWGEVSNDNRN